MKIGIASSCFIIFVKKYNSEKCFPSFLKMLEDSDFTFLFSSPDQELLRAEAQLSVSLVA
jgi:hypothetical protein